MILYEVNLQAMPEIAAAYRDWLVAHASEMLAFDGFLSADLFDDAPDADGSVRIVVQYRVRDRAALDAYLRNHAPRMRADGQTRFPGGFTATRRILHHTGALGLA